MSQHESIPHIKNVRLVRKSKSNAIAPGFTLRFTTVWIFSFDFRTARLLYLEPLTPTNQTDMQSITIASIRAHGVRTLLVYCNGKRDDDWPYHHQGKLAVDCFNDEVELRDKRRCRCTACGWRRADLRPDYSVRQSARVSVGWVMPPDK